MRKARDEHIWSAIHPEADILTTWREVAFVPTADSCTATNGVHGCKDLLDHFVGAGEQREPHVEAERLGGLEVDHEVKFRGLPAGSSPLRMRPAIRARYRSREFYVGPL
jgi:hypothetical protein